MPVYRYWDTWDARPFEPTQAQGGKAKAMTNGRPRIYSDDRLLDILRELAHRLGRTPAREDLVRPNPTTYLTRFGSWGAAIRLAGLAPRVRGLSRVHVPEIDPVKAEQITARNRDYWRKQA